MNRAGRKRHRKYSRSWWNILNILKRSICFPWIFCFPVVWSPWIEKNSEQYLCPFSAGDATRKNGPRIKGIPYKVWGQKIIAELGRQAEHCNYRKRTTCMHRNRKPYNCFSWSARLATSIVGACTRPATKKLTTTHMVTILQLISHASHAA